MNEFFQAYPTYWPEWGPRLASAARVTAEISFFGFLLVGLIYFAIAFPLSMFSRLLGR